MRADLSDDKTTIKKSYRYKAYLTKNQIESAEKIFSNLTKLHNLALEADLDYGLGNYFQRSAHLTELRKYYPEFREINRKMQLSTLKNLYFGWQRMFDLKMKGQSAGRPRFKTKTNKIRSLKVPLGNGGKWDSVPTSKSSRYKRVKFMEIGHVKVRYHRKFNGVIKEIELIKKAAHWEVILICVDVPIRFLKKTHKDVGIDLGIKHFIATSDGELFNNPKSLFKKEINKINVLQKIASNKKSGSNRQKAIYAQIAKNHESIKNKRNNYYHQISNKLIKENDNISMENLKIKNMTSRPSSKKDPNNPGYFLPNGASRKTGLNREILITAPTYFRKIIMYKAERAGREITLVNPQYTSLMCSKCNYIDKQNRKNRALFECVKCDHKDNADINAAVNINRAGQALRNNKNSRKLFKERPLLAQLVRAPNS